MPRQPEFSPQRTWFVDRADAGRRLAEAVRARPDLRVDLVLAIPRGGLPVATPVAAALGVPLDVLVARKIGMPGQPELAIGAATRLGVVWNQDLLDRVRLSEEQLAAACQSAVAEVERREAAYRGSGFARPVSGLTVLIVDDGLATGATMGAAVAAAQQAGTATVLAAVPVASVDAVARIQRLGAEVVALAIPRGFMGVGQFYGDFTPVSDAACVAALQEARAREGDDASPPDPPPCDERMHPKR